MITVVVWLWQTGPTKPWGHYTAQHVNRAAAMIRANLRMQHEIACITDAPSGIDSSIRIIPLWPELADRGRCWRRLKAFAPEMRDVIAPRFAWMDLDMLVTGDLTPLFDRPEDIVLWRSQTTRCPYNGSMVLMTAGARPQVWSDFRPGEDFTPRCAGSDQSWFSYKLGPYEAVWTRRDGVLAYNKYGRQSRGGPPPHCRVIFFPGSVKPNSDIVRKLTPWVQQRLTAYGVVDEEAYQWKGRVRGRDRRRQEHALRHRQGVRVNPLRLTPQVTEAINLAPAIGITDHTGNSGMARAPRKAKAAAAEPEKVEAPVANPEPLKEQVGELVASNEAFVEQALAPEAETANVALVTVDLKMLKRLALRETVDVGPVLLRASEDFPPYYKVR